MTTSLVEIRQAVAALITNGVDREANVKWYPLPEGSPVAFPRISIEPDGEYIDYQQTLGTFGRTVRYVIRLELDALEDETLAIMMDDYLDPVGPSSIPTAINADKTLGGTVVDASPRTARYISAVMAEIPLEVTYD